MKTLFVLVTLIGAGWFALVAAPPAFAVPLLMVLHTLLGGVLLARIIYGQGSLRAFAIGAFIPVAQLLFAQSWFVLMSIVNQSTTNLAQLERHFDDWSFATRVWSGGSWMLCPLTGLVTLAAYRSPSHRDRSPHCTSAENLASARREP